MKNDTADKTNQFDKWKILAETSLPATPVPEKKDVQIPAKIKVQKSPQKDIPVSKEKLPDALPDAVPALPEIPVTMRMNDVSVPVLLKTLARIANINIMINESVKGQVKVNIENVPWDQAFLGLLDTYGLAYEWSGLILRVITVEDLNKKKALMEAKQEYEQSKKEHDISMLQIQKKQDQFEPLLTKIVKIHYADLVALQANLEKYLHTYIKDTDKIQSSQTQFTKEDYAASSNEMRGSIMIDKFANSLILQATRTDIEKIMPIINELDKPIKQVHIEAHIVEANSEVAKELGVQWGGIGVGKQGDNTQYFGGGMDPSGTSLNTAYDPNTGNIVNLPITAANPVTGLTFGVMAENIGNFRLYAQLSALEEKGELNIISRPSITTMDHRKAIIKSGEEVPFQTISADGEIQVEFKEAVIKLEVLPHIISNNIIRLEIITHKDELDWTRTVNGNPTIITKNAETMVTLFDGQTTVIGGLNKEKSSDGEAGVPGLKDVPGLGWLFKSTNKTKDMEELLIFITPYVLKEQKSINKPLQN